MFGGCVVFDCGPVFHHLLVVGAVEHYGAAEVAGSGDDDIDGGRCAGQP